MTDPIDAQASLEGVLKDEILRMYQEVADNPEAEFHFYHGREAAATGSEMECHEGKMEAIPLPDDSVDVVISNGVINLSFQKRKVMQEIFRVLKPGGRISLTDIVSGNQLSQSIVNDPKLWAS